MLNALLGFLVWLSLSTIALAQDVAATVPAPDQSLLPDWASKYIPIIIGVMLVMRTLSELLIKISDALSNDGNSNLHKVANVISTGADYLARACAMFGIGLPASIVVDRAAKINASNSTPAST